MAPSDNFGYLLLFDCPLKTTNAFWKFVQKTFNLFNLQLNTTVVCYGVRGIVLSSHSAVRRLRASDEKIEMKHS